MEEKISFPLNMNVSNYLISMEIIKNDRRDINLVNLFNIPENKKIKELSKGNMQKLALLNTFIGKFDLYILDEPLNGLDEKSEQLFLSYLNKLINKTIIIITHYPNKYGNTFERMIEL